MRKSCIWSWVEKLLVNSGIGGEVHGVSKEDCVELRTREKKLCWCVLRSVLIVCVTVSGCVFLVLVPFYRCRNLREAKE